MGLTPFFLVRPLPFRATALPSVPCFSRSTSLSFLAHASDTRETYTRVWDPFPHARPRRSSSSHRAPSTSSRLHSTMLQANALSAYNTLIFLSLPSSCALFLRFFPPFSVGKQPKSLPGISAPRGQCQEIRSDPVGRSLAQFTPAK